MARIIGIDYGTRRVGLATTDPMQLIATALDTLPPDELIPFLEKYMVSEEVEAIVVGEPLLEDGQPAEIHRKVMRFVARLREQFPGVEVFLQDERYTSKEAQAIILRSGVSKKKRRDKTLVDKVSAVLILEAYMRAERGWE